MKQKLIDKIVANGSAETNRYRYRYIDGLIYRQPIGGSAWELVKIVEQRQKN